jgi:transcriptional regulator with XRE-family HTH domain
MSSVEQSSVRRFGGNVRKRRETLDITQESLAEKAELDQTYISGIENGDRNPTRREPGYVTPAELSLSVFADASKVCRPLVACF